MPTSVTSENCKVLAESIGEDRAKGHLQRVFLEEVLMPVPVRPLGPGEHYQAFTCGLVTALAVIYLFVT